MMRSHLTLPMYQVDAFAQEAFGGNPAGVVPVEDFPEDAVMQGIAAENNLPETAFYRARGDDFELRWFTPITEVEICGHATLAAGHVLFNERGYEGEEIVFKTQSGDLRVQREEDGMLAMDFPRHDIGPCESDMAVRVGLRAQPRELHRSLFYLAVFDDEEAIRNLQPDLVPWKNLDLMGVIVTAPGTDCDFVSRFFAPKAGIDEDPVTGSAHTVLAPYWADRLGKTELIARQLSRRGGKVICRVEDSRVWLCGSSITYLRGEITVPATLAAWGTQQAIAAS